MGALAMMNLQSGEKKTVPKPYENFCKPVMIPLKA
jgi:hypothetical protein